MNRLLLIALCAVLCAGCAAKKEKVITSPSSKVSFTTSTKTPSSFDQWIFIWQMPKIDKDARLGYTVSIGKKEYFDYVFARKLKPGCDLRSDFNEKILKRRMKDFENTTITVTLKVDKGKIEFVNKPKFRFAFWKNIEAKMD